MGAWAPPCTTQQEGHPRLTLPPKKLKENGSRKLLAILMWRWRRRPLDVEDFDLLDNVKVMYSDKESIPQDQLWLISGGQRAPEQ